MTLEFLHGRSIVARNPVCFNFGGSGDSKSTVGVSAKKFLLEATDAFSKKSFASIYVITGFENAIFFEDADFGGAECGDSFLRNEETDGADGEGLGGFLGSLGKAELIEILVFIFGFTGEFFVGDVEHGLIGGTFFFAESPFGFDGGDIESKALVASFAGGI